ncbi:hypothetical protein [Virgibacillus profundi]|nr:hypothetical protein [Virgibacillus profundi]
MRLNMLLGTLLGFWKGEFDWIWWITMLMGGTTGHLIIAFLERKLKNKQK